MVTEKVEAPEEREPQLAWEENPRYAAQMEMLQRNYPGFQIWIDRIDKISTTWYANLVDSPMDTGLPFTPEQNEELLSSSPAGYQLWVLEILQRRASAYASCCPSRESLALWLESDVSNPKIEMHIPTCAPCRLTLQRHVRLFRATYVGDILPSWLDKKCELTKPPFPG